MHANDAREVIAGLLPAVLITGGLAALVAAALTAVAVTRAIMGPLAAIQQASRRIADGDYAQRVPTPKDAELAAVAHDIDALASRLAQTEARRSTLIDEVAHELRTPITTIKGSMEALLDEVIESSPELYARVADEASRLQRLAEDLSTLSRVEEHALSMEPIGLDVAALAAEVGERMRPQFEHAQVALEIRVQPARAHGDPHRLTQVLVNLVGNALGHSDADGTVTIVAGSDQETSWVAVSDTGRGIPSEEIGRIFERFYRVPGASTPGGRGIGLTIARSLARAHGGDVTATSDGVGRGSTFRLALPHDGP